MQNTYLKLLEKSKIKFIQDVIRSFSSSSLLETDFMTDFENKLNLAPRKDIIKFLANTDWSSHDKHSQSTISLDFANIIEENIDTSWERNSQTGILKLLEKSKIKFIQDVICSFSSPSLLETNFMTDFENKLNLAPRKDIIKFLANTDWSSHDKHSQSTISLEWIKYLIKKLKITAHNFANIIEKNINTSWKRNSQTGICVLKNLDFFMEFFIEFKKTELFHDKLSNAVLSEMRQLSAMQSEDVSKKEIDSIIKNIEKYDLLNYLSTSQKVNFLFHLNKIKCQAEQLSSESSIYFLMEYPYINHSLNYNNDKLIKFFEKVLLTSYASVDPYHKPESYTEFKRLYTFVLDNMKMQNNHNRLTLSIPANKKDKLFDDLFQHSDIKDLKNYDILVDLLKSFNLDFKSTHVMLPENFYTQLEELTINVNSQGLISHKKNKLKI